MNPTELEQTTELAKRHEWTVDNTDPIWVGWTGLCLTGKNWHVIRASFAPNGKLANLTINMHGREGVVMRDARWDCC